jgi:tRNA1(Val) A37 N6-methylase TrmN6
LDKKIVIQSTKKLLLYQLKDGYCYNSDTIFLYDFISQFNPKNDILDIGGGCGILGLLIARDFKVNLHQSEIQENMQFLTNKNSEVNKIKNELYKGSFLEIDFNKNFDFIISNPPFWDFNVIQTKNKEKNIARYNHHLPIEDFFKKVNQILKP